MKNRTRFDAWDNRNKVFDALRMATSKRGRGVGLANIARLSGLSRPTINKHLKFLKECGEVDFYQEEWRPGVMANRWFPTEKALKVYGEYPLFKVIENDK